MNAWLRWFALTCMVLAFILVPFALWEDELTALSARLLTPAAGRFTLGTLIVLLLASDVLFPIPSSFVSAGAVSLLGAHAGGITVVLGMTTAAWLGYAAGFFGGRRLVERIAGHDQLERAANMMKRYGSWVLVASRGVPVLAESATLLAGATRLSLTTFAVSTLLGNVGLAAAYSLMAALDLSGAAAVLAPFLFGILVPAAAMLLIRKLTLLEPRSR